MEKCAVLTLDMSENARLSWNITVSRKPDVTRGDLNSEDVGKSARLGLFVHAFWIALAACALVSRWRLSFT